MVRHHDATIRAIGAIAVVILCVAPGGCNSHGDQAPNLVDPDWTMQRERMVSQQIEARGVKDPLVLESMRSVPRHLFVPENYRDAAYNDSPLPIGDSQTISQPYIVALMTELLEVKPGQKVLEIGTVEVRCGDGYGGWPEEAPFDGIIVTAAPDRVPEPLLDQLAEGAKMVIPVGDFYQELKVITRTPDGFDERSVIPVRFVPMTGKAQEE